MAINKVRDTDAEIGIFKDFRYQFLAFTYNWRWIFSWEVSSRRFEFLRAIRLRIEPVTWHHKYGQFVPSRNQTRRRSSMSSRFDR